MRIGNLDDFLENHFIKNNVNYKKINDNNSDDFKVEMSIPLSRILSLKLSDEDKEYIIKYLSNKGILVKGQSGLTNFESDDYITVRSFRGSIPKGLSKEETMEKFKLYQKNHDPKIRKEIIVGNMILVVKVLRCMYIDYTLNKYDLIQAGYIGLIKAVDNYDPSKGSFSTIAVPYIEGYIKAEIPSLKGFKRSEAPIYKIMKQVEKEYAEKVVDNPLLAKKVADEVVNSGIRSHYDENVRRIMFMNSVSLDEILENNEDENIYNLGYDFDDNPLNSVYEDEMSNILSNEIKTLKEKKQKILEMRYGLDGNDEHTLREIGEEFDMTHFGVSLCIERSIDELKKKNKIRALKSYLYKEV